MKIRVFYENRAPQHVFCYVMLLFYLFIKTGELRKTTETTLVHAKRVPRGMLDPAIPILLRGNGLWCTFLFVGDDVNSRKINSVASCVSLDPNLFHHDSLRHPVCKHETLRRPKARNVRLAQAVSIALPKTLLLNSQLMTRWLVSRSSSSR
jgi:hypothetical protein